MSENSGRGHFCEQINDTYTFKMEKLIDDESLGNLLGVHSSADGIWRIMCFSGTKLLIYKNSAGNYDIVQNITYEGGDTVKTCAMTDDHQYIAFHSLSEAFVYIFN